MTTLQNATAIQSSMSHWARILKAGGLTYNGDDLRSMAMQAIRIIDHTLAPTSETAYLGQALDDLTERSAPTDQSILDALTYWDTAYEAEDQAADADQTTREEVAELILHGDADEALRVAIGD